MWADPGDQHEVRCCSDTNLGGGWRQNGGCDVWAESDGPLMGGCHELKTFIEAAAICSNAGARLCTAAELRADCTAGTGCGHDADLIWSSDAEAAP